jgi:tetratricopeptide (TPR) repeat protein
VWAALCGSGIGAYVLMHAWQETTLREAYLPQLEARTRQDPHNGRLQALLGARLAEAKEYPGAIDALTQAVASGESTEPVWLTWAAATAASGDPARADAVLRLGMRDARLVPGLQAALDRRSGLGGSPPPSVLAHALCPQGPHALAAACAGGSFLNSVAEGWGRRHPEASGYATREHWAREQPQNALAQRLWGEALARNRRLPEAEETLRRALALDPNTPETHLALADVLTREGAPGKAGLEYVACLKRRKDWLPALLGLGSVALDKKLLPIGVDAFERAVRQAPNLADAWVGLGRAQYNQRLNMGRALEAFQTAARLAPDRTDFWKDYAKALQANFRFDEAEALLRRRLAVASEDAESHFLLAQLLLEHNVTPERQAAAEAELRASLRLQPGVAEAESRLGQLLLDQGKRDEALAMLEQALRHDRLNLVATREMARAYRLAGRMQEAKAAQESAADLSEYLQRVVVLEDRLQRQPNDLQAHRELTGLYQRGGEDEKARREDDIVRVLQAHPKEAERGLKAIKSATSLSVPEGNR